MKDIRTPEVRERVSAGAVGDVADETITLEFLEDSTDGSKVSLVTSTEPVLVEGPAGTIGAEVSVGIGDIPPGSINGLKDVSLLAGRAATESELFLVIGCSEITGELDVGNILNIWMEVLGDATGIDVGGEI